MRRSFFFAIATAILAHAVVAAQVPGRNVNMVSGTTLPDGDPFLQRQNEPSGGVSTRNPLHLLAGANDYRTVDIPGLPDGAENGDAWLGIFKSWDGGQTWHSTLIPGYPQDQSALGLASPLKGYQAAADPTVRPGTNGLFYYSGIAFDRGDNGKSAVFVSRFIDNNNTAGSDPFAYLGTIVIDAGNKAKFIDKPSIAVDIPRPGGPVCTIKAPGAATQTIPAGTIYIAYQVFSGTETAPSSRLMLATSTDCGATWSKPLKIKDLPQTNQGVQVAIVPQTGAVVLTWRAFADRKLGGDAILFSQSDDLSKLRFKDSIVFPMKPFDQGTSATSFRTNSYPTIAVDGSGRIYLTWTERGWGPPGGPSSANPTLDPGDARVVMTTSRDGVTWTSKKPIENNSTPGHQIMPVVTAAGGKISVIYYDLREDVSKVFKVYVDERDVTTKRHTLDLRVLQADPGDSPAFAPSVQVSEYMRGILPDQNGPGTLEQLQFNVPNLPLFAKGSSPFIGDFVDLAGEWFTRDATGKWIFNTNGPPTLHAFWTDNRDVRPPLDGNWQNYTPPTSDLTTGKVCAPGQTGMRNSNVYTARITPGLLVGAPSNSKPLLPEGSGPVGANRRSFVVFAQNNTDQIRTYRFEIMNQPPDGTASFLQFSPLNDPLKLLVTAVAPRSTSSRTVYVSSSDPTASVKVDVTEIQGTEPGSGSSLGLTGSLTLNADRTNPTVTNPTVTNTEEFNPTVTNPTVTNPTVTNPTVTNPTVTNPTVTNPTVTNPTVTNVVVANPTVTNPTVTNPTVTNPTVTNPDMVNPTVTNAELLNGSLTDTTWTVKNGGNTAGSFSVKTLLTKPAPPGFKTQLLVYKTYTTPATVPNDCAVKTESQMVLVASIPNPTVTNPTVTNPTVTNDAVTNPTVTNASLWLEAGEEAKVTFRVLNPDRTQTVPELVTRPNGQQETVFVAPAFNPAQIVAPAIAPITVSGADAAAGVQTVIPIAPLIVTTTALNDAVYGIEYSAQLTSVGGVAGTRTWSISGGQLPAGVLLSPSGLLSGTPAVAGYFAFEVQVVDTATPAHVARADLFLRAAPIAVPQTLTTREDTAKPIVLSGVVGSNTTDSIAFAFTSPAHGTLSGTAPNLTYTPAADYNGPDSFTFTIALVKSTGTVLVTSLPATISLTVTAVNDIPSFTRGADQTVLEDPGPRTMSGWATAISAGAPDEQATQTVSFVLSNSNNALFAVQPAVAPNGTLTFTPAPDAHGAATVTIAIHDDGLVADGGLDTSAAQTFTISVAAVNDAPSFTKGADQTVQEDAGPQSVQAWASNMKAGPPDESGQTLSFTTSNSNPALFSEQPAIAPDGTLTYTAALDARGTATVTVTLKDSGGIADNGVDTSAAQTFVISVIFSGPPVITTASLPAATRNGSYSQILAADGTTGARTWSIANGSLPPGISLDSATGIISGVAPNTCGTASVTVQVTDAATPVPQTATKPLSLSVTGSLFIVSTTLPTGVAFENYSGSVFASCGNGSLRTWSVTGALPLGVGFNTSTGQFTPTNPPGVIAGPRQNGTFPLTIQVSDGNESDTKSFTLNVHAIDQQVFGSFPGSPAAIGGANRLAQTVTAGATGTLTGVRFQSLSPVSPATSCPVYWYCKRKTALT